MTSKKLPPALLRIRSLMIYSDRYFGIVRKMLNQNCLQLMWVKRLGNVITHSRSYTLLAVSFEGVGSHRYNRHTR